MTDWSALSASFFLLYYLLFSLSWGKEKKRKAGEGRAEKATKGAPGCKHLWREVNPIRRRWVESDAGDGWKSTGVDHSGLSDERLFNEQSGSADESKG